jgi:nucleotide-binding universal stress UspA family protein
MTISRIVVGFDGSSGAQTALAWSAALAANCGAEVIAVEAFPPRRAAAPRGEPEPTLAQHRAALKARCAQRASESGVRIRTIVQPGDPREVLQSTAEAERADLLVVGAYGAGSSPGFLHLGSVVEYLVHHVSRPLAVVPRGIEPRFRTVVLGVDGSDSNRVAVDWTTQMAVKLGLDVTAVAVDEPLLQVEQHDAPARWRREVEDQISSKWAAPVAEAGRRLEPLAIRNSKPAQGLLRVAAKRDADMIVIGTRGLGGFSRLRSGGVAPQVLRRSPVPVVLVPPPAGAPARTGSGASAGSPGTKETAA